MFVSAFPIEWVCYFEPHIKEHFTVIKKTEIGPALHSNLLLKKVTL